MNGEEYQNQQHIDQLTKNEGYRKREADQAIASLIEELEYHRQQLAAGQTISEILSRPFGVCDAAQVIAQATAECNRRLQNIAAFEPERQTA